MRKTATALFILTAIAGGSAAFAQMGPGGPHGMGGYDGHGPMFQEFDANADKVVTKDEFQARSMANFKEADVSKKGEITFEEFQAFAQMQMEKRRQAMMKQHFDKADTNKDGKISADEFKANSDKMFNWMDANKDGKLSADDRGRMRDRMHDGMKHRYQDAKPD